MTLTGPELSAGSGCASCACVSEGRGVCVCRRVQGMVCDECARAALRGEESVKCLATKIDCGTCVGR
jgi:hypothetical protein